MYLQALASRPNKIILPIWLGFGLLLLLLLLNPSPSGAAKLFPVLTQGPPGSDTINHNITLGPSESETELELESEETRNSTRLRCDDARLRCAYRTGCGRALQHYLSRCASVIHGDVNECPEICQYALIALTSTDEGKELMTCDCANNDAMCQLSKERAEICRGSVTKTMNRTRVSCRVATWICNADALCSTALQYYNENCKRMFHGKKCTKRCRNSISILRRQEKAAKLNTCFCDGAEDYDCNAIHRNMDELCYNKTPSQFHMYQENEGNGTEDATGNAVASGDSAGDEQPANRAHTTLFDSASWWILLFGYALLLLYPKD